MTTSSALTVPSTQDTTAALVLGGTGLTGRRVAERLAATGTPVRVGSRSGDPAFDWYAEATWEGALSGVAAVYLTYPSDLGLPGAAERVRALCGAAVAQGARRLVLLSGRGQDTHAPAEQAVREAGVDWTIVRSAWFAQNFSEGFLAGAVNDGVVALPAGDAAEPFVDLDDLADVVVAALTDPGHAGRVYEVTGPESMPMAEAVRHIAHAAGRPVRYQPITDDELTGALAAAGTPEELVEVLSHVLAELRDGRNSEPAPGVEQVLGRRPREFAAFAAAAAATGAWTANDARARADGSGLG